MKRRNSFTLLELLTVITLMVVLLSITLKITRPDREANDISHIRHVINTYQAKSSCLLPSEWLKIKLSAHEILVTDMSGLEVFRSEIGTEVSFKDGSASKSFKVRGYDRIFGMTGNSASSFEFIVGKRKGRMNIFTGRVSLGVELEAL